MLSGSKTRELAGQLKTAAGKVENLLAATLAVAGCALLVALVALVLVVKVRHAG